MRAKNEVIDLVRPGKFQNTVRNIARLQQMICDLALRQLKRLRPASQRHKPLHVNVVARRIDVLVDRDE